MATGMYARRPSFVFGFHGADQAVALDILNGRTSFQHSNNSYDWLGQGVYFWENSLERARQYAEEDSRRRHSAIQEPFVLGAVIDLGECLDLLDQKCLDLVRIAYLRLRQVMADSGQPLPANRGFSSSDFDFKRRELDCAVIRYTHVLATEMGMRFDTVPRRLLGGRDALRRRRLPAAEPHPDRRHQPGVHQGCLPSEGGIVADRRSPPSRQLDRVGLTGLRPSALPHHRTCGFPHPVVEPSSLSDLMT